MRIQKAYRLLFIWLMCTLLLSQSCEVKAPVQPKQNNSPEWQPVNSGLDNKMIQTLALAGDDILYAGSFNGVFKSIDGGGSWKVINNGLTNTDVKSVEIHPSDPNKVYCGTWGSGVFYSLNGGYSSVRTASR